MRARKRATRARGATLPATRMTRSRMRARIRMRLRAIQKTPMK
jgi:hypothetical protein